MQFNLKMYTLLIVAEKITSVLFPFFYLHAYTHTCAFWKNTAHAYTFKHKLDLCIYFFGLCVWTCVWLNVKFEQLSYRTFLNWPSFLGVVLGTGKKLSNLRGGMLHFLTILLSIYRELYRKHMICVIIFANFKINFKI